LRGVRENVQAVHPGLRNSRDSRRLNGTRELARAMHWSSTMSKPIPTVQKYMTTSPHTIGEDQPMALAHRMMREHHVRHLPVLRGAKIVGVVSDRDLNMVETLQDVDPRKVLVNEAMSQEPYLVTPDTALDEVVGTMANNKYGSAVVTQHDKVVGIFTTVDACRAFADLLHTRLAK
jgi:acetoin utilization protein AcuB